MKAKLITLSLVLLIVFSGTVTFAQDDLMEVKIGYSVWVGYGPLFVAQENGYFEEQGLSVEMVKVEDAPVRFTAMAGGELDGLVTTLDTASQFWREDASFKVIAGLDESAGGDGIVVNSDEIETVADLEGKKVGVNIGTVSQFFLEYVLRENGLTSDDITVIKMGQGDVPAALLSGQIDAGVTWEPHLSASVDNGATLLVSSEEYPGLIVDVLILRGEFLDDNPEAAQGLVDAWHEAVDYSHENPEEAAEVMAAGLGGWYETGADIIADWAGVNLLDAERNAEFFGEGEDGEASVAEATLQFAIDFYTETGLITEELDAENMIDPSFVVPEEE